MGEGGGRRNTLSPDLCLTHRVSPLPGPDPGAVEHEAAGREDDVVELAEHPVAAAVLAVAAPPDLEGERRRRVYKKKNL